jgi:hypothetical protein
MKVSLHNPKLSARALGYRGVKLCVGRINREFSHPAIFETHSDCYLNKAVFDLIGSDSKDHFIGECYRFMIFK